MSLEMEYPIEVWDKEEERFDYIRFKTNDKGKLFLFSDAATEGVQYYNIRKLRNMEELADVAEYIFDQMQDRYHRVVRD